MDEFAVCIYAHVDHVVSLAFVHCAMQVYIVYIKTLDHSARNGRGKKGKMQCHYEVLHHSAGAGRPNRRAFPPWVHAMVRFEVGVLKE